MLYSIVNKYTFVDTMRAVRPENFSYNGLVALFEYLDDCSQEFDIEFDPIAICCDYSEIHLDDIERETGFETLDELENETFVIRVDDSTIIYQAF